MATNNTIAIVVFKPTVKQQDIPFHNSIQAFPIWYDDNNFINLDYIIF